MAIKKAMKTVSRRLSLDTSQSKVLTMLSNGIAKCSVVYSAHLAQRPQVTRSDGQKGKERVCLPFK